MKGTVVKGDFGVGDCGEGKAMESENSIHIYVHTYVHIYGKVHCVYIVCEYTLHSTVSTALHQIQML